ncbi:MAG: response regulator [Lachnospiraceae bacterium]|nr:response regulator [Lachnospiraceae bacterium]
MDKMIQNVSLQSNNSTTFCNIYTETGVALTNLVLGGLASEDNLLEAMGHAEYEDGYSVEKVVDDFESGREGVVSFTYNGIFETLYYVPIHGSDWMLTYLIRESVISDQINSISDSIITRSLIQSILTALVLAAMFTLMIIQIRRTSKAELEKEISEAENRMKQQELEEQIAMHEELADALRAAETANMAKSGFVSNMSHEIRTPITAILGMNEMIKRECDDETILSYAENIRKAGESLLGIISDILDFSKIEAGRMELSKGPYSLKGIIGDLYNLIRFRAEAKGLELNFSIDPKLPKGLIGDELRVKQIIVNILTNAVKYTEKGGVLLEMTAKEKDGDRVKIYVAVTDTGIGIRKEEMDRLFSAFERLDTQRTRSIEGSGLGLSITRQLLQMMQSDLSVESTYNEGSRFSFELWQGISDPDTIGSFDPKTDAYAPANKQDVEKPFKAPGRRILIVDDTPMNLQVIAGLLKRTEMEIETASGGKECIDKFGEKDYDMVFLDYRMPEIDGIETVKKLKVLYPEKFEKTPVISLTASAVSGDREKLLAAGHTDYLPKPVNIADMEKMLRKYIKTDDLPKSPDEEDRTKAEESGEDGFLQAIAGLALLDPKKGMEYCGDEDDYIFALQTYRDSITERAETIERSLDSGDLDTYSLTVHSIKRVLPLQ